MYFDVNETLPSKVDTEPPKVEKPQVIEEKKDVHLLRVSEK